MKMKFVIIGAGLTGSVIARKRATKLFVCLRHPSECPLSVVPGTQTRRLHHCKVWSASMSLTKAGSCSPRFFWGNGQTIDEVNACFCRLRQGVWIEARPLPRFAAQPCHPYAGCRHPRASAWATARSGLRLTFTLTYCWGCRAKQRHR